MMVLVLLALAATGNVWARSNAPDDSSQAVSATSVTDTIVEVRVEGHRRVEAEAVKRALVNKVGRPFDAKKTGDDLRALWALKLFSDIELLVQRLPKGGLVYVVRVKERAAIHEIRFEGNKELSKDDLTEVVDLKPFSILDWDAVRRNEKKIVEKYVEKGFFLAEVTHRFDPVADSEDVDVVFSVRENSKVMVKEIRFIGTKALSPKDLKAVMATKEGGFLSFLTSEGTYREELFQRDLAMIQASYYDKGFVNVKVEKPQVSISADKKNIFISLKIEEGEAFSISKVDVAGELLESKELLLQRVLIRPGELFSNTKISQDIMTLANVYSEQGYAYANIIPQMDFHPESRTIDLTYEIQQGKQVTIERIDIVGNVTTRDTVIRRELRVYEGELFRGGQLRRSKERVTALGFFETVEATHKPGSSDSAVVVLVEVKEKQTGTFQAGLGYSNFQSIIINAQVSQNNLFGWGTNFSLNAQWNAIQQIFQLSYFDPHFLDSDFIFNIDLFNISQNFGEFIRNSTGGTLNWGYQLGALSSALDDVMVNVSYNGEYIRPDFGQLAIGGSVAKRSPKQNFFREGLTSSMRLSATWDKRNNRIYPTNGYMLFASAEYAPSILGGDFLFAKYSGFGRYYLPLPWGFVFKVNATMGYIQELPGARPLPITEFYRGGGINSLRGYGFWTVSPSVLVPYSLQPDSLVDIYQIGGNKQAIFNFELEFPIAAEAGFRGVFFYDAGNVFAKNAKFFEDRQYDLPLGMLHSVGLGFRWFSPMGPLRFEWGFPLIRRPDRRDEPYQFQFTIGSFF